MADTFDPDYELEIIIDALTPDYAFEITIEEGTYHCSEYSVISPFNTLFSTD